MNKTINGILGTLGTLAILGLTGCGGGGSTNNAEATFGTTSTLKIEYGYYGPNKDMGSSDTIRLIWTKNTTMQANLELTSDIDTSTDSYLSSKYGTPHYSYSIDKATKAGVYTITCDPVVSTGIWVEYRCLRDGMFYNQQDTTLDNRFVIKRESTNRVYDVDKYDSGTQTLGFLTYIKTNI